MTEKRRIYTKNGDLGDTQLLFGATLPKDDLRCEAYGDLDEANSAMGLARSLTDDSEVKGLLLRLQRELFTVGAELATEPQHYDAFLRRFSPVTAEMVSALEREIDRLEEAMDRPWEFLVPGGSPASSALDLARAIVRRTERRAVSLHRQGRLPNAEVIRYLNRLSDLLYVLARYHDRNRPFDLAREGSQ